MHTNMHKVKHLQAHQLKNSLTPTHVGTLTNPPTDVFAKTHRNLSHELTQTWPHLRRFSQMFVGAAVVV